MKRVGNLNKEIRRLKDEGVNAWPMASPTDLIKTRRCLTSLFSDFAFSKNDRIKIWTGLQVASNQIRMSLTELGIPQSIRALVEAGEPLSY